METIYCTLNAKRLTFLGAAGRKASGGETVCYAVAPRPRGVPQQKACLYGKISDHFLSDSLRILWKSCIMTGIFRGLIYALCDSRGRILNIYGGPYGGI